MAVNPLGYVQLSDFGNPRTITGYAREVISGGQLVGVSGTTGVVSSGADSFVSSDIAFIVGQGGSNFTGIAMNTVVSGAAVSVAVDGMHILRCVGSVFAGMKVYHNGADAVLNLGSTAVPADGQSAAMAGLSIGRALTEGASGGFCVVLIK